MYAAWLLFAALSWRRARGLVSRSGGHRRTSALSVFDELAGMRDVELQEYLRRDVGRRRAELIALGWLGRAYRAAPQLFEFLAPAVFKLDVYDGEDLYYNSPGAPRTAEVVLKESSVVGRGVPLRLRLGIIDAPNGPTIAAAELVAVGCDIAPVWPDGFAPMAAADVAALCGSINADRSAKLKIVDAVVAAIFFELNPAFAAREVDFEPCGPVLDFMPRRDLWAREGSAAKWLQKVSAYYFSESKLRDVRIKDGQFDLRFTFYFDPTEPANSLDGFKNTNPEVLCCKFASYPNNAQT
ncbi:hypothetical protein M885DRAFT_559597 [Pelagophyceae sp. CCMP2097]|nr:hypothetical protein M885DRAFT_559597 [Pelagophyceae sp. CCMP2097]